MDIDVCFSLERVNCFESLSQFKGLEAWIKEQILLGKAQKVGVRRPFSGADFEEIWIQHVSSAKIWRLVAPAPPFLGVFEEIEENISNWKGIDQFKDERDFEKFQDWMLNEIKTGKAETVVRKPCYDGDISYQGKWFRHISSGEIWRLEIPQGECKGSFLFMK